MKKPTIIIGLATMVALHLVAAKNSPASLLQTTEEEKPQIETNRTKKKLDRKTERVELLKESSSFGARIRGVSNDQQNASHALDKIESDYKYKLETTPKFVEKSLDWLAQAQHDDGSWGASPTYSTSGFSSSQQVRDPHAVKGDPATTSFAAMAFLRSGHTPKKGKYKDVVRRATEALVQVVEEAPKEGPRITNLTGTQPQAKMGAYVDTSLTARYLARVLNEFPKKDKLRKRVDKAIDKCIAKIQGSQQKDGSWSGGGGWAPVLQSSLAGQALELAQAAGKQVDQKALDRARDNQKGNIDPSSGKAKTDTAAGVELYAFASAQRATAAETWEANDLIETAKKDGKLEKNAQVNADNLRKIGVAEEKAEKLAQSVSQNERQQARVQNDEALLTGFGNNGGEEYLSYLMTSESLVITGGEAWEKWDEKMHRRMNKIQSPNGSWSGHHCITSPVFCTAAVIQCLNTYRDTKMLRNAALASSGKQKDDGNGKVAAK